MGNGKDKNCKSNLRVRRGSLVMHKDPLHQGLGLHPGAQEGSRDMKGSALEAKTTPATGE